MATVRSHFINGEWLEGTGKTFVSIDPATTEEIFEGRYATQEEVDAGLTSAVGAFDSWADLDLADRIVFLEAFREQLISQKKEFSLIISRETGKPFWESMTEVDAMIGKIPLSIQGYEDRCGTMKMEFGPAMAITRFRPHGAVAVFGPFNFPGHLPNGHITPALLAGNTVILKPSEQAPTVAQKMVELWQDCGLPRGVLNMVQGDRETGIALAGDPRLSGLFFTGSAEVGKALHRQFGGKPEKILALELGGNNPLIVYEAEDIEAAAYITIQSAFITAGQRCTCARRVIVQSGKESDLFISSLLSMIRKLRVGPYSEDPEPFMGPVISEHMIQNLLKAQRELELRGGKPLARMQRVDMPGYFLTPGVMDVTEVSDRTDEELFGPFLQLIRVPDFKAAILEANNTAFGLVAGLISDNPDLYQKFLRRIRAGVVNWNRQTTGATGKMPFGGIGISGNHRPSGYFAADYCSYPVASLEMDRLIRPEALTPGIEI